MVVFIFGGGSLVYVFFILWKHARLTSFIISFLDFYSDVCCCLWFLTINCASLCSFFEWWISFVFGTVQILVHHYFVKCWLIFCLIFFTKNNYRMYPSVFAVCMFSQLFIVSFYFKCGNGIVVCMFFHWWQFSLFVYIKQDAA